MTAHITPYIASLSTDAGPASGRDAQESDFAWQREMERAQLAATLPQGAAVQGAPLPPLPGLFRGSAVASAALAEIEVEKAKLAQEVQQQATTDTSPRREGPIVLERLTPRLERAQDAVSDRAPTVTASPAAVVPVPLDVPRASLVPQPGVESEAGAEAKTEAEVEDEAPPQSTADAATRSTAAREPEAQIALRQTQALADGLSQVAPVEVTLHVAARAQQALHPTDAVDRAVAAGMGTLEFATAPVAASAKLVTPVAQVAVSRIEAALQSLAKVDAQLGGVRSLPAPQLNALLVQLRGAPTAAPAVTTREPVHAAASPAPRRPAAPHAPMRLHADWSAEGVRLWLGLDANLLGQLSAIAEQVRRWMSNQGVRVLSFSCNGHSVSALDSDTEGSNTPAPIAQQTELKEKPWPSAL